MKPPRHFLLASDFDQTLSFNDSGLELSELLGVRGFEHKVAGLAHSHLVQQGGELAYLIRHDPEFRGVRREHLVEAGRRVRLKGGLKPFVDFLARGVDGNQFSFYVVSAAPREVVVSALDGIVPAEHIFGTELDYDPRSRRGEWKTIPNMFKERVVNAGTIEFAAAPEGTRRILRGEVKVKLFGFGGVVEKMIASEIVKNYDATAAFITDWLAKR